MDQKIVFKYGLQSEYDSLGSGRSADILFFVTDSQRLYRGDLLMATGKDVTSVASGLMSPEQFTLLQTLSTKVNALETDVANRTVQKIETSKGIAEIKNEQDSGGIFYTEKGSTGDEICAYMGLNDGSLDGLYGQLYVDHQENGKWVGTRINAYEDAIYYTNLAAKRAGVANNDPDYEIATKKDIADIEVPEYNLTKEADPGDYAAIYHLTKDGVAVGEAINIAKDQMLKSVEVKVCTEKDVPVEGLVVGDKYLDFTFIIEKGEEVHRYIAIKDMVKPYTAGEGIEITAENAIKVDTEAIATVEYVDANISDTMNYVMQEDAAERAARIAGDDLINATLEKKTDAILEGATPGTKARMQNEIDGGYIKMEGTTNHSAVAANDGGSGIGAQMYNWKMDGTAYKNGSVIDVTEGGVYYYSGNYAAASARDIADNEIATKKDVADGAPKWEPIA